LIPSVQKVLREPKLLNADVTAKLDKKVFAALESFKQTNPYRLKPEESSRILNSLFETLRHMYDIKDLHLEFDDTDNNLTEYDVASNTLMVPKKNLNLMQFLNKFAMGAFNFTESQAKEWSEELFRKTYPKLYKSYMKKERRTMRKENRMSGLPGRMTEMTDEFGNDMDMSELGVYNTEQQLWMEKKHKKSIRDWEREWRKEHLYS
jgi:hypothetical protein